METEAQPLLPVLDLTHLQHDPPAPRADGKQTHRLRAVKDPKIGWVKRVHVRAPDEIKSLCIHQTACVFGARKPDIAQHGEARARHMRALGVAAHLVAFRDGQAVLANPLLWFVHHGNTFNATSVGIEIEGIYPGLMDDPSTLPNEARLTAPARWEDVTPFTQDTLRAAQAAVEYALGQLNLLGARVEYVDAHRQSSMTRRADPGEEPWRKLVLEWLVPRFGLRVRPAYVVGGRPLPDAWGGAGPY